MSQEISNNDSPLDTIPPRGEALTALFNKDPLEHTVEDRKQIISALRAQRKEWKEKETKGKAKKAAKASADKISVDLGSLDIQI